MTNILLGDIGNFNTAYDYMYNRDLQYAGLECTVTGCDRLRHVIGTTSVVPVKALYDDKCVYHYYLASRGKYTISFTKDGYPYTYDGFTTKQY